MALPRVVLRGVVEEMLWEEKPCPQAYEGKKDGRPFGVWPGKRSECNHMAAAPQHPPRPRPQTPDPKSQGMKPSPPTVLLKYMKSLVVLHAQRDPPKVFSLP